MYIVRGVWMYLCHAQLSIYLRLTQQIFAQKMLLLYFIFKATCFGNCHLQANI
jgi:hypothetical protein